MFYLERIAKKGEDVVVELLEDGQGFGTHTKAWSVKDQKYPGLANVVITWYENPPKPKKKA